MSFDKLMQLRNGKNALEFYNNGDEEAMSSNSVTNSQEDESNGESGIVASRSKRTRTKVTNKDFVDSYTAAIGTEGADNSEDQTTNKKRRLAKGRVSLLTNNSTRQSSRVSSRSRPPSRTTQNDDGSDSDPGPTRKRGAQPSRGGLMSTRSSGRVTRSTNAKPVIKLTNTSSKLLDDDDEEPDELAGEEKSDTYGSDIVYARKKINRRPTKDRRTRSASGSKRASRRKIADDSSSTEERIEPTRRSGRDRGAVKSMRERDMDEEIYADEVTKNSAPKVISIREVFQPIPKQSEFRILHNNDCDVCGGTGTSSNKGPSPLIYCQGCSTSIHKVCLGYRSNRDHVVTKVGHEDFVMQCRRCIGIPNKKDPSAPRLDTCQSCKKEGPACAAFSPKRTAKQEEKLREENDGDDPITEVPKDLINNAENVLFRCETCHRCYHFEHLPALSVDSETPDDVEELRNERFDEYTPKWQCKECLEAPAKVDELVCWRPADSKTYVEGTTADMLREDQMEYLVKWEKKSHFKCTWMPGAWVWGVAAGSMRKAFFKRDEGANLLPKWTEEEAIPEAYLRIEIVFDVSYKKGFRPQSESSDRARVDMVDQVFAKFQGLTYDESVWEDPPKPEDEDRWSDYVAAYNEYIAGKYFKQPPAATMKERGEAFRSLNFEKKIELKKQPSALTGGKMMPYQMEGLNWLLYNFHQKKNVILADEMGLGKTIQIISFMAYLVKDNPKVYLLIPFGAIELTGSVLAVPCGHAEFDVSKLAPRNQEMGSRSACSGLLRCQISSRYGNGIRTLSRRLFRYESPCGCHFLRGTRGQSQQVVLSTHQVGWHDCG